MKKFLKIVSVVAVGILVLAVCVGAWLVYLAKTRLPNLDGVISHPSLRGEVRVIRDDWGVPHIEAGNEPDAYFALGYAMAQDRLFQMEVLRRLARGEAAELLGPLAVPIDKIMRSFRLRPLAEAFFAQADGITPELKQAAEAFVAGINSCMEREPLPFEFSVLHIPVRPFTPADCLTVARILPITFADGLRTDSLVTLLKEHCPDKDIDALFPGYSKEIPTTVMESLEEAETYLKSRGRISEALPQTDHTVPVPAAELSALLKPLASLSDLIGPALGSNSWVLGPSRSQSGKPILANDPHIGFTNPSIWYEAHVTFGDFDLYGYYLPLIPFALLGQNTHHAWAMTMFANDDLDLYREKFHPDDPNKVMYKGEWVAARTETETIKVRFGRDQQCTVRTTPHGPVITDLFRRLNGYQGPEVALSWVWQRVKYTDLLALYRMGRARDCDSFGEALSLITSPGINVSYADRDGNIAWWAAGLIPIRPKHVNPKTLLDGASGNDEILGYVPFAQNPHLKNPSCGYIATANNKSTVKPVGPIEDLQGYWQPGDREGRIKQLLESRAKWSVEDLKAVQFDDTAYAAPRIVATVLETLKSSSAQFSGLETAAMHVLAQWDGGHGTESVGACIYQVLCDAILEDALRDEMGEQLFKNYGIVADHWNFFKYFITDDNSPYWDDVTTPERETRRDILLRSFRGTVSWLEKRLGRDIGRWNWGRIHTLEFKHPFGYLPLLGRIFNIGPFPASGGAQMVNNMLYARGRYNYDVLAGPSTRRLIDFGDPEHARSILPTGNSGNFMSPHYGDQAAMFMAGRYREARMTREQIQAHKLHEIRFLPAAKTAQP
jgi:penicillin amidase